MLGAFIFDFQSLGDQSQTQESSFSWVLILIVIGSLLIGRIFNIYLLSGIGYLIMGKSKWRLNYYEYQILYASGIVKGAVPFALILTCPNPTKLTTNTIQTTVIIIVYLSSLFFNSLLPKILRNRQHQI